MRKTGRLDGWKIRRLDDWTIGRLDDWTIGRLDDWITGRVLTHTHVQYLMGIGDSDPGEKFDLRMSTPNIGRRRQIQMFLFYDDALEQVFRQTNSKKSKKSRTMTWTHSSPLTRSDRQLLLMSHCYRNIEYTTVASQRCKSSPLPTTAQETIHRAHSRLIITSLSLHASQSSSFLAHNHTHMENSIETGD